MHITLHIERLLLDGLPVAGHEARIVERSIRHELTRLVAEGGISPAIAAGGATPSLPAQTVARAAPQPNALGRQIAGAAYRSVGGRTQ